MRIAVGKSVSPVPGTAASEAMQAALAAVTVQPRFALVLSTDQYQPAELASAVNEAAGELPWAGCSTAGVFVGSEILRQGLVIGLFCGDELRVGIGLGSPVGADPRGAGREALAQALQPLGAPVQGRHRAVILLPDAFTGNGAEVVRGALQETGAGPAWAGGAAGDDLRYSRATQFAGGRAVSDAVVAIVLDSPARFATGIRHGWRPSGPPSMVTRSHGATADELDYEPAFDVYQRTAAKLGGKVTREEFGAFAITHPLGMPGMDGRYVIRDPLIVEKDGGLRCFAEIPDGSLVRMMEGDREGIPAAAGEAAQVARDGLAGPPAGAVVFDCISRSLLLGKDMARELAAIQQGLGPDVPFFGCMTFGEIGAVGASVPQFHNMTAVVLALPG